MPRVTAICRKDLNLDKKLSDKGLEKSEDGKDNEMIVEDFSSLKDQAEENIQCKTANQIGNQKLLQMLTKLQSDYEQFENLKRESINIKVQLEAYKAQLGTNTEEMIINDTSILHHSPTEILSQRKELMNTIKTLHKQIQVFESTEMQIRKKYNSLTKKYGEHSSSDSYDEEEDHTNSESLSGVNQAFNGMNKASYLSTIGNRDKTLSPLQSLEIYSDNFIQYKSNPYQTPNHTCKVEDKKCDIYGDKKCSASRPTIKIYDESNDGLKFVEENHIHELVKSYSDYHHQNIDTYLPFGKYLFDHSNFIDNNRRLNSLQRGINSTSGRKMTLSYLNLSPQNSEPSIIQNPLHNQNESVDSSLFSHSIDDMTDSIVGTRERNLKSKEDLICWRETLHVGDRIDAADASGDFFEALVREIDVGNKLIKVHFLGWSDGWDEEMPLKSERIQPRYSKVEGWRHNMEVGDVVEIRRDLQQGVRWFVAWVLDVKRDADGNVLEAQCQNTEIVDWFKLDGDHICAPTTHISRELIESFRQQEGLVDNKDMAIHNAAKRGTIELVKRWCGFNPNLIHAEGTLGYTALMYAALGGCVDLVKYLLEFSREHFPNMNILEKLDNQQYTVLMLAAKKRQSEVIKYLIKEGAPIHTRNKFYRTVLHYAADVGLHDVVELLLIHGAHPNARDCHGCTPLRVAAFKGAKPEIVKLLLRYGADPTIEDGGGSNAIEVATKPNIKSLVTAGNRLYLIQRLRFIYSYFSKPLRPAVRVTTSSINVDNDYIRKYVFPKLNKGSPKLSILANCIYYKEIICAKTTTELENFPYIFQSYSMDEIEEGNDQINMEIDLHKRNSQGEDQKLILRSNSSSPTSSISCSPPLNTDPNRWSNLAIDVKLTEGIQNIASRKFQTNRASKAFESTLRSDAISPSSSVSTYMNNYKQSALSFEINQQRKFTNPSPRTTATDPYECIPSPTGATIRSPFVYKRNCNTFNPQRHPNSNIFHSFEEPLYSQNCSLDQHASMQPPIRGVNNSQTQFIPSSPLSYIEAYREPSFTQVQRRTTLLQNTIKKIQYQYNDKREVANSFITFVVEHNGVYCQFCSDNAVNHEKRRLDDSSESMNKDFNQPVEDFSSKNIYQLNEVEIDIGNCSSSVKDEISNEDMLEIEVKKGTINKMRTSNVNNKESSISAEQKGESGYIDDFEDDSRMDESIKCAPMHSKINQAINNNKSDYLSSPSPSLSIVEESESKQNNRSQQADFDENRVFMERIFSSTSRTPLLSPKHTNPLIKIEDNIDLDYPFCEEFVLSTDSGECQEKRKEHYCGSGKMFNQNSFLETKPSNTTTIFESIPKKSRQSTDSSSNDLRPCDVMVSFNPDEDEEVLSLLIKVADTLNPDLFDEMVSYFGF